MFAHVSRIENKGRTTTYSQNFIRVIDKIQACK
jgi:hypothetical protein